jgi:putative ABC transport system permease protein
MTRATIRQILAQRARLVGASLAIMIGVGFTTATLLFGAILETGFRNAVGEEYKVIDFVLESSDAPFTPEMVGAIEAIDGVVDVQPGSPIWIEAQAGGRTTPIISTGVPDPGQLRDTLVLASGRLPEAAGEVTLLRSTARSLRVDTGDSITLLMPPAGEASGQPEPHVVTVVGLWSGDGRFGSEDIDGFLTEEDLTLWSELSSMTTLYVMTDPGAGGATVESRLTDLVGGKAAVTTAEQRIDREMLEFETESELQRIGVAAFGIIALIVAGIVVSNTFTILIAQRTRDIALFRCAGATAGQVRQMVLAEAFAIGAVASAIGIAGAVVVTNAALRFVGRRFDYEAVPNAVGMSLSMVAWPLLAGLAVTLGAAWVPARTTTRIEPLQSLRIASLPIDTSRRTGPVRTGLALLALAGGAALLLGGIAISRAGSVQIGLLSGIAGGLATSAGVFLGASIMIPVAMTSFSRIVSRFGGVPARVAASNSVRNPRRTTATAIALVIGVALVTMMSVGAASLKATLLGAVDVQTPWDLEIRNASGAPGAESFVTFAQTANDVDGVAAQALVGRVEAELPGTQPGNSIIVDARVVDPTDLANVWRDDAAIAALVPGVALAPAWLLEETGIADGGTAPIEFGGASHDFQAAGTHSFESLLIAESDVAAAGLDPAIDSFWLRLDDDADANRVLDDLYKLADEQGVTIDAGDTSDYRQTLTTALDALLLVITGLLGVAVLIALVGVGNTLSLSVIERTRESALLRALGFTRRQLRQSLAIEGVVLSLLGCLIGIVLGTGFGWIGTATLVGDVWPLALAFPWARIGVVVVVAITCGLLASVLPARRAVRADPVVALADV